MNISAGLQTPPSNKAEVLTVILKFKRHPYLTVILGLKGRGSHEFMYIKTHEILDAAHQG